MRKKYLFTFGVIAKTSHGTEYVPRIGNYVLPDCGIGIAINSIAEIIYRAPCDIFIDAINDVELEKPTGLYGNGIANKED